METGFGSVCCVGCLVPRAGAAVEVEETQARIIKYTWSSSCHWHPHSLIWHLKCLKLSRFESHVWFCDMESKAIVLHA